MKELYCAHFLASPLDSDIDQHETRDETGGGEETEEQAVSSLLKEEQPGMYHDEPVSCKRDASDDDAHAKPESSQSHINIKLKSQGHFDISPHASSSSPPPFLARLMSPYFFSPFPSPLTLTLTLTLTLAIALAPRAHLTPTCPTFLSTPLNLFFHHFRLLGVWRWNVIGAAQCSLTVLDACSCVHVCACVCVTCFYVDADGNEVYFKARVTTQFSKVMSAYCKKVGADLESVRFLFDGTKLLPEQTPAEVRHTGRILVGRTAVSGCLHTCCPPVLHVSSFLLSSGWTMRTKSTPWFSRRAVNRRPSSMPDWWLMIAVHSSPTSIVPRCR